METSGRLQGRVWNRYAELMYCLEERVGCTGIGRSAVSVAVW